MKPPSKNTHWHQREVLELLAEHTVDPELGLASHEVQSRAQSHGPNELQNRNQRTRLSLLADQFKDFMVLVLLAAAANHP